MSFLETLVRLIFGEATQAGPAPHQSRRLPPPARPAPSLAQPPMSEDTLFWGARSALSRQIITEQVFDVAENIFKSGVDFDEANAHWFVVPRYQLPFAWKTIARETSLMIVFPTLYPEIPPIGFYLKASLPRAPAGHFYTDAYHNAAKRPLAEGWKWYCVYVNPGSWQPSSYRRPKDWQRGDNLYTYLTLVKEVLSDTRE